MVIIIVFAIEIHSFLASALPRGVVRWIGTCAGNRISERLAL